MPETNKYQYCISNNEILELHVLEEEFYRNKQATRDRYRGQLLCPECKQVRLSIKENSNGIYLAAYPNSVHTENCEYLLKPAARRELRVFYDQIAPDRAEQMLERILDDRIIVVNIPQNQNPNDDVDQAARDLALDEAGGAVGEGVLQHAHHHQPRREKGGVAHAFIHLHVRVEHVAEDEQIQQRRENGRANGLQAHFPKAQHFFVEQGLLVGHQRG